MKTTNWQTKALTLFIAAVAFCLTAACGSADTTYYPYPEGGLRIVSSDTCEIEVPLAPSQEFADLPERMRQRMENDPNFAYTSMNLDIKTRRESRYTRLGPEFRRIWNGFYAYEDKLRRYPYYSLVFVEELSTWDGVPTDRTVVEIHLEHMVDLRTIPSEYWIPSCIAGVPVHIVVGNHLIYSDASPDEAGIQ